MGAFHFNSDGMEVKFFKDGVEIDPKEIRAADVLDLAKFLLDSPSIVRVLKTGLETVSSAKDVGDYMKDLDEHHTESSFFCSSKMNEELLEPLPESDMA